MATYNGHQEDASGNLLLPTPHSLATVIELGDIASQAYSVGTFLVYNDRFYKVIKAIAKNDTFYTSGDNQNISVANVGTELSNSIKLNGAMTIPASSTNTVNLNTYTIPGNYTCTATANSPYVTNQPKTSGQQAFNLIVIKNLNSSAYLRQMFWYHNDTSLYVRYSTNSGSSWSAWNNLASDTNTTYTFATGDANGQIKVTPSGGTAQNVSVKGLGSNAYTSTAHLPLIGGMLTGNLTIDKGNGTTSSAASSYVILGNNKSSTTAGNTYGAARFFSTNTGYVDLRAASTTESPTVYLPATAGTLALTSQLTNGSVTKVGTSTVGASAKPIYLASGVPTAFSTTVGAANTPVYLSSGTLKAGNEYVPKSGGTFTGNLAMKTIGGDVETRTLTLGGAGDTDGYGKLIIYSDENYDIKLGNDTYHTYGIRFYEGACYANLGNYLYSLQEPLDKNRSVGFPNSSGIIQVSTSSSRRIKKNIRNMSEEEAKKLLELNIVKFDYKDNWCGGAENQSGVIAEDTINIIPEVVHVGKNYDPNQPVDEEYNAPPDVDYRKFIPYLIKLVQIQQEEINELRTEIQSLKES